MKIPSPKHPKVYVAIVKMPDGSYATLRAKRDGRAWSIGGDYDYHGVGSIWDLTDAKAYRFNNGRLQFSDGLSEAQVMATAEEAGLVDELKASREAQTMDEVSYRITISEDERRLLERALNLLLDELVAGEVGAEKEGWPSNPIRWRNQGEKAAELLRVIERKKRS